MDKRDLEQRTKSFALRTIGGEGQRGKGESVEQPASIEVQLGKIGN
jgi:hypothetical protein